MIQVIRRGADLWEVWRVEHLDPCPTGAVARHEPLARVRLDGPADRYVVERPNWHAENYTWVRDGGLFLTEKAALRSITHPRKERTS